MRLMKNYVCCVHFLIIPCLTGAGKCPPYYMYSPCSCLGFSNGTIELFCYEVSVGDDKMSSILDVFLNEQGISPLGSLFAWESNLTYVPKQINFFPQLYSVVLSNNRIASVEKNAFNLTRIRSLSLSFNEELTTIAPGAFQGNDYGNLTFINMDGNSKFHRFESTVWKSLLDKIVPYDHNAAVFLSNSTFDCSDCHLAWLIRDNRHMLPRLYNAMCSNGSNFEDLDPNGFAGCPDFVCPLGYDGLYPDYSNHSKFYQCTNSTATLNDCPKDSVFNPETSMCEVMANVSKPVPFICP